MTTKRIRALAASLIVVGFVATGEPSVTAAQSANVTIRTSREVVGVGDMFDIEIIGQRRGPGDLRIEFPELDGFTIADRRMPVQVSGNIIGQEVHRLTLLARAPGRHTIGPARLFSNGREYESNTVTIEVGPGSGGDPVVPGAETDDTGQDSTTTAAGAVEGSRFDSLAFLRTVVDNGEPYVGQQTNVTVYFYTRRRLSPFTPLVPTREPTADGFWTQSLTTGQTPPPTHELIQGQPFYVYTLRHFAAFPLRSGRLVIGAPEILVDFGGRVAREGVEVPVNARELPTEGRPAEYVHVGALQLSSELDRSQVPTGDAVTFRLTVTGQGPLSQIEFPDLEVDGLSVLPPQSNARLQTANGVVGGTRTIEWLIVPQRAGAFSLGPIEVHVFDPRTETYSVARASALTLTAAGNPVTNPSESTQQGASTRTSEPDEEAPEFSPIRPQATLARTHFRLVDQSWFRWLFALGPALFALALIFRSVQRRRAERAGLGPSARGVRKIARQHLTVARSHVAKEAPSELYASVSAALKNAVEAELGEPVGGYTLPELRAHLVDLGMDPKLAGEIIDELEGCDFARFSAVGRTRAEMEACLSRAERLVGEIQRFVPTEEDS